MLIALIDDGIETSFVPSIRVKYDLSVGADGIVSQRAADDRILTDHGTTCARIIAKYAPKAEFCSLRIFQKQELRAACSQLLAAMQWCLAKQIPIVHMSLGSSQPSDFRAIRSIIARMLQQRQIIVAACSNSAAYSMPARLNGVLGVVADKELKDDEYTIMPNTLAGHNLILASSRHELALPTGGAYTTQVTNSYAAPTVTAAVHNILERSGAFSLSVVQMYAKLSEDKRGMIFSRPDFVEDAVILNPCGYPVLRQHLFFNYLRECTDLAAIRQASELGRNIVYLAPQGQGTSELYEGALLKNNHVMQSLLYAGSLPKGMECMLDNGLVWSENCCTYGKHIPVNQSAEPPVVVNLYGQGLEAVDTLCQLRDLSVADGYQCRGICDYPHSYLYDLEFLPRGISPEAAFSYVSQVYWPDVIISNLQMSGRIAPVDQDSYSVLLGEAGSYGNALLQKNVSCLKPGYDKDDILLVYDEILRYFL